MYGLASMALVTSAIRSRDEDGIPVVGLDIAGAEAGFPADAGAAGLPRCIGDALGVRLLVIFFLGTGVCF